MGINNLHIMTGQVYQGILYAACYEMNALCKIDIHSGDTEFIGHFLNEEYFEKALYRDSVIVGDTIYFIPDNAAGIGIYHISESLLESVELPEDENEKMGYDGMLYDDKIMLVPFDIKKRIVLFDMKKKIFEYQDSLNEKIQKIADTLKGRNVYRVINIENKAILPVINTPFCLEISFPQKEVELKKVENESVKGVLPGKDRYFIFVQSERYIYECSDGQALKKIEMADKKNIFPIFYYDEKVLGLDKESNQICTCSNGKRLPPEIVNSEKIELTETKDIMYFRETAEEKTRILYSVNMNGIIVDNGNKLNFVKMNSKKENMRMEYIDGAVRNGAWLMNEEGIGLTEYVKYICRSI